MKTGTAFKSSGMKLPADFQSSRAGRGIWAGMKRGIGEFDEAAQLYLNSTKQRANPIICRTPFLLVSMRKTGSLPGFFTEYLVQRSDYAFMLPDFLERLPRHIRLDELYIFHCCADARLPDVSDGLDLARNRTTPHRTRGLFYHGCDA